MSFFQHGIAKTGAFGVPSRGASTCGVWIVGLYLIIAWTKIATAAAPPNPAPVVGTTITDEASQPTGPSEPLQTFYIKEFRAIDAHHLKPIEVEEAIYPYMGPERTVEDIDHARAALEKAYKDKGYQTVSVQVPQQTGRGGIVMLQVIEAPVGRLRVKGAKYFLPSDIKSKAPSLAEGSVPNFNDVTTDIMALNQLGDRQVTPVLRPGVEPDTVDIDLNVKDRPPLHSNIELNNRYSANTTELRLNGSISYTNLWQAAHSAGFSFQVAPQRPEDAKIFSAYYIAPVPGSRLSLMLQGTKQDSNVSTLGGAAVAGRGNIIGARALITLPTKPGFYQSLSFGIDYKHFDEDTVIGLDTVSSPIDYYPISLNYGASWTGKKSFTEFNGGVSFGVRGVGSDQEKFDAKRFNADGSFLYFKGDISHTQELPFGFQIYGKIQGQATGDELIVNEQLAGGGLNTVRGYLEAEAIGDQGIFGTVELRSPSLIGGVDHKDNEWRVYAFYDAGRLTLNQPLPEQQDRFDLSSFGFGSRIRLFNHLNGSVDAAIPLVSQTNTIAHDVYVTFRVWADF